MSLPENFTGRTLEQESGEGWPEGVHPDDRERCTEISAGAFARHEPFSMTYRLRRHDGEYRWIQTDSFPRYDPHSNFPGYIGHCPDITLRRLVEEALRETMEKRVLPASSGRTPFENLFIRSCETLFRTFLWRYRLRCWLFSSRWPV